MSSTDVGRLFRHSTIYAIGNALNRVGAFLLLPIYTRHLSTAEYGALETFYMVSAIISGLLAVGIAHATLRFYFDHHDLRERHAVVSTNLIASLLISAAGIALLWPAAPWVQHLVFQGHDFGHAYHWMLGTIVFELSSQVALAYIRAIERSILFVTVALAKLLLQVVVNSVALLVYDAGVEGVLAGNFLTVLLGWLLLGAVTVRDCGLRFQWAKLMPVLRYSLPFLATAVFGIAASTADRFIVQALVSLEALGLYALASKFSKLVSDLIGEPVNRAYGSFRFTIMGQPDAALTQARITRYLSALLLSAGLAVSLLTPDLLRIMSAPAFHGAGDFVPLLVLAAVLQTLTYPLQTGVLYEKRTGLLAWASLAQGVTGVLTGLAATWAFGILGACLGVLAAALVNLLMTWHYSGRYFPVDYRPAGHLMALAIAAALCALGFMLPPLPLWASIPVHVALAASYPVVLVLSGFIRREEVAALAGRLRRPREAA